MLAIVVPQTEYFDESCQKFVVSKPHNLMLEHSLVSLAKWEAKWKKPFLSKKEKTPEELLDYIKFMTITQNVSDDVYRDLACHSEILSQITDYIKDPMTATTFSSAQEAKTGIGRQVVTAEIIYYWMIQLNIPVEFQKWHLNRLLALIKVCDLKTSPKKKMPRGKIYSKNRQLNAARRAKLGTNG